MAIFKGLSVLKPLQLVVFSSEALENDMIPRKANSAAGKIYLCFFQSYLEAITKCAMEIAWLRANNSLVKFESDPLTKNLHARESTS